MSADIIKDKARKQAIEISEVLKGQGQNVAPDSQMIALVAYLKALGSWEEKKPAENRRDDRPLFQPGNPDEYRPVATTPAPGQ
jgi:hypothetical protein